MRQGIWPLSPFTYSRQDVLEPVTSPWPCDQYQDSALAEILGILATAPSPPLADWSGQPHAQVPAHAPAWKDNGARTGASDDRIVRVPRLSAKEGIRDNMRCPVRCREQRCKVVPSHPANPAVEQCLKIWREQKISNSLECMRGSRGKKTYQSAYQHAFKDRRAVNITKLNDLRSDPSKKPQKFQLAFQHLITSVFHSPMG